MHAIHSKVHVCISSELPFSVSMAVRAERSDPVNIYILDIGEHVINYTVPSFPVFSARLRSIKFQLGVNTPNDKSSLKKRRVDIVYDSFIRESPSLQRSYPAWIVVDRDSTDDSADSFSVV